MENLADIRNQIDQLDKELASLLVQRTNLALEAYKCKQKKHGIRTRCRSGKDRTG